MLCPAAQRRRLRSPAHYASTDSGDGAGAPLQDSPVVSGVCVLG